MGNVIGTDLGTTNSVVAAVHDGEPRVAENAEGKVIIPSVVHFPEQGQPVVGDMASRMAMIKPDRTVQEVKRLRGEDVNAWTDPVSGDQLSPPQIEQYVLGYLIESAEAHFGEKVEGAVISVPAYFTDAQRKATEQIGQLAGVSVLGIRNEPSMALRVYCYTHPEIADGLWMVVDLGGGTFDCTVAQITGDEIHTVTTDGHRSLGGTDFTLKLQQLVLEGFKKKHGVEFDPQNPADAAVLRDTFFKAEQSKKELSKLLQTAMNNMGKGVQVMVEITRREFEELCKPEMEQIRSKVEAALKDSTNDPAELDGIVLVGGATRMPCIQALVKDVTEGQVPIHKDISTDRAVALGCAIEAYSLSGKTEYYLGVRRLRETTSFNIGVACHQVGDRDPDRMVVKCLVPKGCELPAEASQRFGLDSMPGSSGVPAELTIAEGEDRTEYTEDMKVQAFPLGDLPPGDNPREPRIEVTVQVSESGIITAQARDLQTGKHIREELSRKAIA